MTIKDVIAMAQLGDSYQEQAHRLRMTNRRLTAKRYRGQAIDCYSRALDMAVEVRDGGKDTDAAVGAIVLLQALLRIIEGEQAA